MTLPAAVRVNVGVFFPTQVRGAGYVAVSKSNGIWTVSVDYTVLAPAVTIPDTTTKLIAAYDTLSRQYNTVTIAQIAAAAASIVTTSGLTGAILNTHRTVTDPGDVVVDATTDEIILLDKTVGAPTNIILPTAASRQGVPLTVKDLKGDAATNNITFVPNGSETIDGFSGAAAAANGVALIDMNYGKKMLYPLASGGWYL